MKHLLSFFVLLLTALETSAYDVEVDGLYYNLNSETLTATLTAKSTGSSANAEAYIGDIVVPESITVEDVNYTVTGVASRTFYSCDQLTSVVFPSTVTTLGTYIFNSCKSLTSCTLPEGITTIPTATFISCTSLTDVNIPSSVDSIGISAFCACKALKNVTLPNTLHKILESAFYGCSMERITLPDSLREIGYRAFYQCNELVEITIPNKVEEIATQAFYDCPKLEKVVLGTSVKTLNVQTFNSCPALTDVYFLPLRLVNLNSNSFNSLNMPRLHVQNSFLERYATNSIYRKAKEILPLQCAVPYIYCENGNLQFYSDTNLSHCTAEENVNYTITALDDGEGTSPTTELKLLASYLVKAVASASEILPSDTTTVTISWANCAGDLYKEGELPTSVDPSTATTAVICRAQDGILTVDGLPDGTSLRLFTPEGRLVATATSIGGTAFFHHIPQRTTLIVNFGEDSIKVWSE